MPPTSAAQLRYRKSTKGKLATAAQHLQYNERRRIKRATDHEWREQENAEKRAAYAENSDYRREAAYYHDFGIKWKDREALIIAQDYRCAICQDQNFDTTPGLPWWHTDHDPKKKKGEPGFIRGMLCIRCNTGLGKFKENAAVLLRASQYVGG